MATAELVTLTRRLTFGGKHIKNPAQTKAAETINIVASQTYTHGTGANQANQPWGSEEVELAGAPGNIDLSGVVKDAFNATVAFSKIKELWIYNLSGTSGKILTLTGNFGDAAFAAGGTFSHIVPPNGHFHVSNPIDGYTVTAGTGDIITIDPGDDTITYKAWILGVV